MTLNAQPRSAFAPFLILTFLCTSSLRAQPLPIKLPATVNTENNELAPVISADGNTLYFARTRLAMDSSIVFDIWRSQRDANGEFGPAEIMSGALSSRYGIAVTSIAPDNNTLYLMGKMDEFTPPDERIYVSHKAKTGWTTPQPLHIDSLRVRGVFTDYTFGPDQKTLIMAVERDSSMGSRDLYVSFLDEARGRWSEPRWLGPRINSAYTEMTPFLAADNKTLYFSSDRPNGFGDIDVYRAVRQDDSWQNWSFPENLGPTVNHPGRTLYYSQDARSTSAYFVWRKALDQQTDIFRMPVAKRLETAIALVHGHVHDNHGKPLGATIRYEDLTTGAELGSARSDPATGEFQLSLPAGKEYDLRAQKEGFAPTSEHLDIRSLAENSTLERDLELTAIVKGAVVKLNSIFFETDKSTLLPTSFPELDRLKSLLDHDPKLSIAIEGHTDSLGSAAHNQQLSKSRAEAVRDYLASRGIAKERLSVKAYGATIPVAPNTTEEGRSQNRRVQFRVLESSEFTAPE